ncbi:MAG: hypothetical protein ACXVP1_08770 [Thermoleophilia bacterium]
MPKVSKTTGQANEYGFLTEHRGELEGYTVNFIEHHEPIDATPMLKGLPGDHCNCPHWGYVFKGRLTFRFPDHEEVFEAGDAFYLPPGHIPIAEAGTEYMQFSPAEELARTNEAIMRNMQAAH